ncbi:MAG: biotin--[acetyl-CoA-carboxylase] ligase [Alphaproteobacteria bacterium]|nr:biotin--[acetyl-CoA-carboxylase] ligase [Alphaproteobacteria bacterium]
MAGPASPRALGAGVILPATYRLHAFEQLSSTNEEAKRLAAEGEAEGAVVWALHQTAGRGRQGRVWHSPVGGLYLSILVRPGADLYRAQQLSFVAGLALLDTAAAAMPGSAQHLSLKWPNDILLDAKKLAGILLESAAGAVPWLIVGLGLNVEAAPEIEGRPAIALGAPAGPDNLERFIEFFVGFWDVGLQDWRRNGFAEVRARWLRYAADLGQPVTARLAERTLTGIFKDLDEDGALILTEPTGATHRIVAGEVFGGP